MQTNKKTEYEAVLNHMVQQNEQGSKKKIELKVKLGKCLSIKQLMEKTYDSYEMDKVWIETIGEVEKNFKAFIWGMSGSGKSTFTLKLCKELVKHGKVYYNSIEQGDSKTFQTAVRLAQLPSDLLATDFSLVSDTFEQMMQRLRTNRAHFVVIDSVNAGMMTVDQYNQLVEKFPKKAFIFVGWSSQGGQPRGNTAGHIRYWSDIKIYVQKGIANADSRYGNTKPYYVFGNAPKPGDQLSIDNQDSRNNLPVEETEDSLIDN